MAINQHLLNQAANPGPAPIDSFLPAFRGAQDRRIKHQALAQENESRLAKMKMDWTKYVQEQREKQAAADRETRVQAITSQYNGDAEQTSNALLAEGFIDEADKLRDWIPDEGVDVTEVTRYTPEGQVRVGLNQRTGDELWQVPLGEKPGEGDQRDRKIRTLVGQPGVDGNPLDYNEAAAIVDGIVKYEINEKTGQVNRIDTRTGTVTEQPIAAPESPVLEQAQRGPGLYESAQEGTGAWSWFVDTIWNRGVGQIPGVPIVESVTRARQVLKTGMGEMRRGMAINQRFPVGEMERLEEEIEIKPSAWDSPEAMRARMRSIDKSLERRIEIFEADANDPSLPSDVRGDQRRNAGALRAYRELLAVPQGREGGPEVGSIEDEYQYLGGDPSNPDNWEKVQ